MSTPGPGDPETWGPTTGHPNDPRNDDHTVLCNHCHEPLEQIDDLTWIDSTGGDVCGTASADSDGDNVPHEPDYVEHEPDYEAIAESIEYERSQSALYRLDQEY